MTEASMGEVRGQIQQSIDEMPVEDSLRVEGTLLHDGDVFHYYMQKLKDGLREAREDRSNPNWDTAALPQRVADGIGTAATTLGAALQGADRLPGASAATTSIAAARESADKVVAISARHEKNLTAFEEAVLAADALLQNFHASRRQGAQAACETHVYLQQAHQSAEMARDALGGE